MTFSSEWNSWHMSKALFAIFIAIFKASISLWKGKVVVFNIVPLIFSKWCSQFGGDHTDQLVTYMCTFIE